MCSSHSKSFWKSLKVSLIFRLREKFEQRPPTASSQILSHSREALREHKWHRWQLHFKVTMPGTLWRRIVDTKWFAPNIELQVSAQKPNSIFVVSPTLSNTPESVSVILFAVASCSSQFLWDLTSEIYLLRYSTEQQLQGRQRQIQCPAKKSERNFKTSSEGPINYLLMSYPFPRWYWRNRLKAGKFPDKAFGAFLFIIFLYSKVFLFAMINIVSACLGVLDTLKYGMVCMKGLIYSTYQTFRYTHPSIFNVLLWCYVS